MTEKEKKITIKHLENNLIEFFKYKFYILKQDSKLNENIILDDIKVISKKEKNYYLINISNNKDDLNFLIILLNSKETDKTVTTLTSTITKNLNVNIHYDIYYYFEEEINLKINKNQILNIHDTCINLKNHLIEVELIPIYNKKEFKTASLYTKLYYDSKNIFNQFIINYPNQVTGKQMEIRTF